MASLKRTIWLFIAVLALGAALGGVRHQSAGSLAGALARILILACVAAPWQLQRTTLVWLRRRLVPRCGLGRPEVDPLTAVRQTASAHGDGVYLGMTRQGPRFARAQRAVLVLGPPRSGKSSAVMIPTVIAHPGAVVSTSTKPDVARATVQARSRTGRVWVFDPTGTGSTDPDLALRWSPVMSSASWDGALLMARAMTTSIGTGTTDRSHWAARAQALLAPLLHAAAVHGRDIDTVVDWVMCHQLDQAGVLLEDQRCAQLAFSTLLGLHHTEDRERSSIFSATADALQAYTSQHALAAARNPNFDADAFARSQDTVYITAPAEKQAAVAPIVCGLLSEIRRATYRAHAAGQLTGGWVLFALDEVANIAPLAELPQIASEGGGQGLLLLAALQDLSQARSRWGAQADGFLTLFGTKLILRGVADPKTLDAISTMLGEYDRRVVSHSHPDRDLIGALLGSGRSRPQSSTTYSTQRARVLSPGEIANIPTGRALHLDGVGWELVALTPAHAHQPWRALTTLAAR